jgi:hypothetical protein
MVAKSLNAIYHRFDDRNHFMVARVPGLYFYGDENVYNTVCYAVLEIVMAINGLLQAPAQEKPVTIETFTENPKQKSKRCEKVNLIVSSSSTTITTIIINDWRGVMTMTQA